MDMEYGAKCVVLLVLKIHGPPTCPKRDLDLIPNGRYMIYGSLCWELWGSRWSIVRRDCSAVGV